VVGHPYGGDLGVLGVWEHTTTILWKDLSVLASVQDAAGWSGTYEIKHSSEEANVVIDTLPRET